MTKTLKEKIENTSKNFWNAASVFAITHGIDIASTLDFVKNGGGIDAEKNDFARHLMHQSGVELGLTIAGGVILFNAIGLSYLINKSCEKVCERGDSSYDIIRNAGSIFLYALSVNKILTAINNYNF